MSPLDRELMTTLGELVLAKNTKTAAEKEAFFRQLGAGADWLLRGAGGVLRPAAQAGWRVGKRAPKKLYDVALEAGGIKGISKEHKLLELLRARQGMGDAWDTVRDLAKARGMTNPVTAFKAVMDPMKSLTPRVSESGYARWLLGELKDPVKRQQFLVNATPQQAAAVKKLEPYFAQAHRAGEVSMAGRVAPFGIIGGPLAYNLATSGDDNTRPVVTAPNRGFSMPTGKKKGMMDHFWGSSSKEEA